jgi:integrase/recombinase XerD
VILLLYSGMRISDAIRLKRSRVDKKGRLMIRMMKTGGALYVRLPEAALQALAAVPIESEYFLWTGKSKLSTAVGSARRTIGCLGRLTEIPAHPHRFRDTFSVELLKTGASLRTVQLLLGHTSIKTTEKHYAPWVQDFQKQLDEATSKLKFG